MKRRNILVIIALLAACGYFVSLQFPEKEHLAGGGREQKNNPELELKIQQLNDLLQAKESLELVQPVKQKENTGAKSQDKSRIENLAKQLKEKENILADLKKQLNEEKASRQAASREFKRISEELRMAKNTKSALERALSETEKKKDELKTTNTSLKEEARAASLGREKLGKEKEQLRAQLELLNKTYSDLQNEYLRGQEVLKQNETESGRRADRILVLEEKLTKAETQLAD